MPVINIEYDGAFVSEGDMQKLSEAMHEVTAQVTGIEDVPVYTNNSHIKIAVSPIEVFIRLSAQKTENMDTLMAKLKQALSEWKTDQGFQHKINVSLIPMDWKIEVGV